VMHNAIKFTERGGVTVRVARSTSGALTLMVKDTGVGIEQTYLAHLFEPFSQEQSSPARRYEGAGLGLALTRRYLELNGATLKVASV
jgi:signal transduction histidine kinase